MLYTLLIEIGLQLIFGKVSVPFIPFVSSFWGVDIGIIELGRGTQPIPPEVIANGMVLGSLYSLVAMGLILVYRGNRIINFAQAQLGAVPAVIALLLIAKRGVPYLAVLPIVILGAALLGAATEVTLVRRFSQAPRLIVTVVTIGVSIVLVVMEFFAKQAVGGDLIDTLAFDYNSPVSSFTYRWGVQTFKGDHLMTVVIVGIAVLAMSAFFKFTDMGIAVRASAENGERASLLGIPVKRVSTIVWALAAVLSSIGIFLRGPLIGINLTGNTGLGVLLFGLAIAVMAKMESMPMAFGAGLLIGAINEGVIFATNRAAVTDAVMFVVIIAALLIQRGACRGRWRWARRAGRRCGSTGRCPPSCATCGRSWWPGGHSRWSSRRWRSPPRGSSGTPGPQRPPSSSSTPSSACPSWCSPAGRDRSRWGSTPSPAWRPEWPACWRPPTAGTSSR